MKSIMKKTLGLLMILCMVVCAFSLVKVNVTAAEQTATYTFGGNKDAWTVNVTGTAPVGSTATYTQTYTGALGQITKDNSETLTINGYEGYVIKSITLSMHSNKSAGTGKFSLRAGSTTIAEIATNTGFNQAAWYGAWTQSFVDVTPAMSKTDYVIKNGEAVVFNISASANSLFCQSISITYEEGSSDPVVDISGAENVLINNDYKYEAASLNIEEPGDPLWVSSDEDVATIDEEGNLTPIAMGTTSITATINGTESDPITVKVWPDNADSIGIDTAIAIAEFAGSENSAFAYTCSGTVNTIDDANNFVLFDGLFTITVYKYGHGCNLMDQVTVNGFLKTYGETKEFSSPTISTFYTVSFNSKDGSEVDDINNVPKGSKIEEPDTPTKEGYTFVGWYKDSLYSSEWDFDSDTVNAHVRLYAKWISNSLLSLQSDLNAINPKMAGAYKYDVIINGQNNKTLTIDQNSFNSLTEGSGYTIYNGSHYLDGITYKSNQVMISSKKLQFKKGEGYMYNETAFAEINSITIDTDTYLEVYVSTQPLDSSNYSSATKLTGVTGVYTPAAGNKYFYIKATSGGTPSSSSIVISYTETDYTYENVDFRFKAAVEEEVALAIDGIDGAKYGIEVSDGTNTKKFYSDDENYLNDGAGYDYVIIDLGDVLNNDDRLDLEFTVKAFAEVDEEFYYSGNESKYSVSSIIDKYMTMNAEGDKDGSGKTPAEYVANFDAVLARFGK